MHTRLLNTQLALRNSTTRLPFRYGKACLTWCPQAILQADVEVDGVVQSGHSGDCLPPSWFDKSPGKDYDRQIEEMIAAIQLAGTVFGERFARATPFFPAWIESQAEVHRLGKRRQWPGLLVSFGISMVERAMLDAIARAQQMSFASLIRKNLLQVDAAAVHPSLAGLEPRDWLPVVPSETVYVRHTVGLSDPLTSAEIRSTDRLDDGQPQSLEEYVERSGIRYLKIKVCNQLGEDVDRIRAIAGILQRHRGDDYLVTLDGNEQYHRAEDFDRLVDAIKSHEALGDFWRNTLLIEQPLARDIALSTDYTNGIRRLSLEKPVIIDESDEALASYSEAIQLGYRGVSSKNCKGPLKSILNAGLTWRHNQSLPKRSATKFVMSGEDLCCVGVVPLQSDLCLVATLGLQHVERNGHHYHNGLSYLPVAQQEAALEQHGDLYGSNGSAVRPRVRDGQFHIASLQCVGFGFAVKPDFAQMKIVPSPDAGH